MSDLGHVRFLPWVRAGAAASIATVDARDGSSPSQVQLAVGVTVNEQPLLPLGVTLYGPGDVTGLDPRHVVRIDPVADTRDFEPNHFPAIEFDRPDFPWLFTPARADAQGRLRPWVVLVVVREQDGIKLGPTADGSGFQLSIDVPARLSDELPDLSASWAWAHAQVTGDDPIDTILSTEPGLALARLLCPRRLQPRTAYLACVVPAFKVGVMAGLGQPIAAADLARSAPAWVQSDPSIRLPVYYHWQFATGDAGDFETLVRQLKGVAVPSTVGVAPLDASTPGFDLPSGGTLQLGGILRAPTTPEPALGDVPAPLRAGLTTVLDAPPNDAQGRPIVAPPIYGRWLAAVSAVPPSGWVSELGLDPRMRVFAALAANVVQSQREQLMASAWDQAGDLERCNRVLKLAQFARAVSGAIHGARLSPMTPDRLVGMTAPSHTRVLADAVTVREQAKLSSLPAAATTPALRRAARPRGPVARGAYPPAARTVRPLLNGLAAGTWPVASPFPRAGAVSISDVDQGVAEQSKPPALAPVTATPASSTTTPKAVSPSGSRPVMPAITATAAGTVGTLALSKPTSVALGQIGPSGFSADLVRSAKPATATLASTGADAVAFQAAAATHQAFVAAQLAQPVVAARPPFSIGDAARTLLAQLNPQQTVANFVLPRLQIPKGVATASADPLEPVMAAPDFPQPMSESLRELAPQVFLPGMDGVPADSVSLLESNGAAIEAFLVGLNHEMARLLLWRGYPTDQRGTCFRQFWDVSGRVPPPSTDDDREAARDIKPITSWIGASDLGTHLRGQVAGQLVLLVRGALLRRYPNTVIYAVEATWSNGLRAPGTNELYPLFRGTLDPDVTFVGFPLTVAQAIGSRDPKQPPGWYFVLQEHPHEPRFGDDGTGGFVAASAADAAQEALAALRVPTRLAIHAEQMLVQAKS